MSVIIVKDLCIGCGNCADACPQKAITIKAKQAIVDPQKCDDCEECVFVCIYGAIVPG
ncbi:MAG: 4Fe-4S binding protein [Clostridiales bacterium]|nr:4Fe-4S binding protein [Clostridiales bacterium]MCF8021127.1 4Fe-4S binding protein [Clostridiales bacterium]